MSWVRSMTTRGPLRVGAVADEVARRLPKGDRWVAVWEQPRLAVRLARKHRVVLVTADQRPIPRLRIPRIVSLPGEWAFIPAAVGAVVIHDSASAEWRALVQPWPGPLGPGCTLIDVSRGRTRDASNHLMSCGIIGLAQAQIGRIAVTSGVVSAHSEPATGVGVASEEVSPPPPRQR